MWTESMYGEDAIQVTLLSSEQLKLDQGQTHKDCACAALVLFVKQGLSLGKI